MLEILQDTKKCALISGFSHLGLIEWFKALPSEDLSQEIKERTKGGICYALVLDWLMNHDNAMTHQFYETTKENKKPASKIAILDFFNQKVHKSYFIKMAHNFYNYTQLFTAQTLTYDIVYKNKTIKVINPVENFNLDNLEVCNLYKIPNYFNGGAVIDTQKNFCLLSYEISTHFKAAIYANIFFKQLPNGKHQIWRHTFGFQRSNNKRSFSIEFFDPTFGVFNLGQDASEIYIFLHNLLSYYNVKEGLEYVNSFISSKY